MPLPFIREFRLARSADDRLYPALTDDGAIVGGVTPLLEKDAAGRWLPRPRSDLETILERGYGPGIELRRGIAALGAVARALNKGDPSLAAIALVQGEFPALPDDDAPLRMVEANWALMKDNPDIDDEPRISAGQPDGGEWIGGGDEDVEGDSSDAADPPGGGVANADAKRPASDMSVSDAGKAFVKDREGGLHLTPYTDGDTGNTTIGWGHKLAPGESYPNGITRDQAQALFDADVARAQALVRKYVTADLTQNQFDALTSFAFNLGPQGFRNADGTATRILRDLNANDFDSAADELLAWDWTHDSEGNKFEVEGLKNRHAAERTLFLTGKYR